eukprot:CCRYP_001427-RD/>CCRYP_001427-RD protein AED:0.45 eAED:0.73 QI:0/0/0/1/0/0/2/0/132
MAYIKAVCVRDWNKERGRLFNALNSKVGNVHEEHGMYYNGKKVHMNKGQGAEMAGFYYGSYAYLCGVHSLIAVLGGKPKDSAGSHEAAVEVKADPTSLHTHYTCTFLANGARLLRQYPRYVERAQKPSMRTG